MAKVNIREQQCSTKELWTEMPCGTVVRVVELHIPSKIIESLKVNINQGRKCCEIQRTFIQKNGKESVEYAIHCKWKSSKNAFLKIPLSTWNIDHNFFHRHCKWAVDKLPDIAKGILHVKIILSTGIRDATPEFVKYWFNTVGDFNLEISEISQLPEDAFKELKKFQTDVLKYKKERKVQHENLSAHLRPYQRRAVQWMISRESDEFRMQSSDCTSEPVFQLQNAFGVKESFYYPYSEYLSKRPKPTYDMPEYFRGGILSDEMGLGKTVVVLALILNNPRVDVRDFLDSSKLDKECEEPSKKKSKNEPAQETSKKRKRKATEPVSPKAKKSRFPVKCICLKRDMVNVVQCPECCFFQHKSCLGYSEGNIYFCCECWGKKTVESKATLIITPQSILQQWEEEVKKHVKIEELKIHVYKGLKEDFVQPSVLASCDIVLTTFETLNDDFHYMSRARNGLYLNERVPPIQKVKWWRLCLDEAQMVEQGQTKNGYFIVGTMAKSLSAVNKWNVTGTPVESSIGELYNLIRWIGVAPFDDESFWERALMDLYERGYVLPLFSVLSQIFWRNTKADVENEMVVPNLTTVYHTLKFTPIESCFYMRELNAVYADFRSKLEPGSKFLRALNGKGMTLETILAPMLHLRQACSHHLAVRDKEISNQKEKKGAVKKDINHYMSLGSLLEYLIEKTKTERCKSLKKYVDYLSRLAALNDVKGDRNEAADYYKKGLAVIKEYKEKGVKVEILQEVHVFVNLARILKSNPNISTTIPRENLEKMAKALEHTYMQETTSKFKVHEKLAEARTFAVVSRKKNVEDVIEDSWSSLVSLLPHQEILKSIEEKVSEDETEFLKKVDEDVVGTITDWWGRLIASRDVMMTLLTSLWKADVDELVAEAADCHLGEKRRKFCRLCYYKTVLSNHKRILMARTIDTLSHNVEHLMGVVLILSQSRSRALLNCKRHFTLLQEMKREQSGLESALVAFKKLVEAKYKLNKAKARKDEGKIEDVEKLRKNLTEKSESTMSTLKKKHGTLLYLKNLMKMSDGSDPDDRDPCPVCLSNLEREWCFLECGHSYCMDCITTLLQHKKNVTCPICREVTNSSEIGYADVTKNLPGQTSVLYSTKITAIVDTILSLKKSDPDVKVLIFSTWDVVLTVLKKGLDENGISYRGLPGKNPEKSIQEFKNLELKVTALLFPISYGVTGLNLTEATHVFFVEPTVNMADEQQAIGRIHRMGQTKETFVHRFCMSGTIEEKIYAAVKDAKYMPTYSTLEDVQKFYDTN